MKGLISIIISSLFLCSVLAQDSNFSVELSSDSVLFGNYFKVTFTIENGQPVNFTAPAFEDFIIVSGPNQSSSLSIINGESTQSLSYTYYVQPKEEGLFFIEPASVDLDGQARETEPISIVVLPNPEGIIQKPEQEKNRMFDSFFDFDSPLFPDRMKPKNKPENKPKKKRKIYRI